MIKESKKKKIVLTGGGTGGHFYPLIAVAEALRDRKGDSIEIYFITDKPYEEELLRSLSISFIQIPTGKRRLYFSIQNFIDIFKVAWSIPVSFIKLLLLYPDIVFSKGGHVSFPVLVASRLLQIPVVVHESDSVPGRTNKWAGKFAERIALSYPEAASYFDNKNIAVTGQPIRKIVSEKPSGDTHKVFDLEQNIPTLFITGGSQGAQILNTAILGALPRLVSRLNVIHQTGPRNDRAVAEAAEIVLISSENSQEYKNRYKHFPLLSGDLYRSALSMADIVITRAGSTLFEVALWGIPTLVVPITESNEDHQRKNAYAYARTGAGTVIEEENLSDDILISEIDRILSSEEVKEHMKEGARKFQTIDAASTIAGELISIAESHE